MSTFKRLTAEEAEPLFQAGAVMHFDANGTDDPEHPSVVKNYNKELHGRNGTASPLDIVTRSSADNRGRYRWWVEVE